MTLIVYKWPKSHPIFTRMYTGQCNGHYHWKFSWVNLKWWWNN